MKQISFILPVYTPDILEYIAGREVVCQLVLEACQQKLASADGSISIKSKLFTRQRFSIADVVEIITVVGRQLKIKFSYTLIFQLNRYASVEDLATQLWKYTCKVVKCN